MFVDDDADDDDEWYDGKYFSFGENIANKKKTFSMYENYFVERKLTFGAVFFMRDFSICVRVA